MNFRRLTISILWLALIACSCQAEFSISYSVVASPELPEPESTILRTALAEATEAWERLIVGHTSQPILDFHVNVNLTTTGLASARPTSVLTEGGFTYPVRGAIWMNRNQIIPATDGLGIAPGVDIITELLAHETAHALGFGTLWQENDLYEFGSGRYTGEHGLAAYRAEFDPDAEWVPVEQAGPPQSADRHWDQIFRSSPEEGDPDDPLSLSPLTGITDELGRDLGLELLTAAIDPDHGEPFLSNTTIQSFRDLGYHVVPEPDTPLWYWVALSILGRHCISHGRNEA